MRTKNRLGIFSRVLFALAAAAVLAGLVVYTDECRESAGRAAALCIETILPSLFPFLVLSNFFIGMGYVRDLGRLFARPMRWLFNLGGACAGPFLLGILGGYPVGAKSALALYESGQCSKAECERLLAFCNNSGPAFIFGVVGAGIFASSAAAALLYGTHVLAAVTVGILFRFYKRREALSPSRAEGKVRNKPRFSRIFTSSVTQALASVGNISAFVIFFAVVLGLLSSCGLLPAVVNALHAFLSPLSASRSGIEKISMGFLEMTAGLGGLSGAAGSMGDRLCMAAFILGWAGVSVHCQVLSFLSDSGLSLKPYFFGKLLHGVLSAVYTRLFLGIFLPAGVSAAAAQAEAIRTHGTAMPFVLSAALALFVMLFPYIRDFFKRYV